MLADSFVIRSRHFDLAYTYFVHPHQPSPVSFPGNVVVFPALRKQNTGLLLIGSLERTPVTRSRCLTYQLAKLLPPGVSPLFLNAVKIGSS